jgi:hypothetical protein
MACIQVALGASFVLLSSICGCCSSTTLDGGGNPVESVSATASGGAAANADVNAFITPTEEAVLSYLASRLRSKASLGARLAEARWVAAATVVATTPAPHVLDEELVGALGAKFDLGPVGGPVAFVTTTFSIDSRLTPMAPAQGSWRGAWLASTTTTGGSALFAVGDKVLLVVPRDEPTAATARSLLAPSLPQGAELVLSPLPVGRADPTGSSAALATRLLQGDGETIAAWMGRVGAIAAQGGEDALTAMALLAGSGDAAQDALRALTAGDLSATSVLARAALEGRPSPAAAELRPAEWGDDVRTPLGLSPWLGPEGKVDMLTGPSAMTPIGKRF